jgi:hypothetical protein
MPCCTRSTPPRRRRKISGPTAPAVRTGIDLRVVQGNPNLAKASTSYVERQNLSMRMGVRRFTRLTNAFSTKIENLAYAVSRHYMLDTFARSYQTLGTRRRREEDHARGGCRDRQPRVGAPRRRCAARLIVKLTHYRNVAVGPNGESGDRRSHVVAR